MPDYIQTTAKQWLIEQNLHDLILSKMADRDANKRVYTSDALNDFSKLIIEQCVENCAAHSDTEIDKEGAIANTYKQFGL